MKEVIKKNMLAIALAVVGAAAGLLYWKLVGCKTGSCPIKSKWYLMTAYGIITGYLVGDIIKGYFGKKDKPAGETDNPAE